MIPLNIVMQRMHTLDSQGNATIFDIEVKAANLKKDTFKQILRFESFYISQKLSSIKKEIFFIKNETKKKANHYLNDTINIKSSKTGEIRKIHTRLITRFNSETVIY